MTSPRMAAVDLDRQAIERRDFPIGRRGYEAAAVDAHLRGLAAEFEELQRAAIESSGESSLASAAGSQVQSIIQAAETAAAEIERQALEHASRLREGAERDAKSTRDEAIETARAQVAAVSRVAATLLERVGSMDGELATLIDSLGTRAASLAEDLTAVETGMGELYDAASGRGAGASSPQSSPPAPPDPEDEPPAAPAAAPPPPQPPVAAPASAQAKPTPAAGGELDGARLIALNMALNGEPRAETERYLAENFELADRAKLVDEVYAAVET
jgi:hypothetical protein